MTVLFMEGLELYAAVADLSRRGWSLQNTSSVTLVTGASTRFNYGRAIRCALGSSNLLGRDFAEQSTAAVGFALWIDLSWMGNQLVVRFMDGTTAQLTLNGTADRRLQVRRGTVTGTVLGETAAGAVPVGSWIYVELRINGDAVILATGVNTQNTGNARATRMRLDLQRPAGGASDATLFDDIYLTDGDLLGDSRVYVLTPAADTARKDFTPNAGSTNHDRVNQLPRDADTTYVEAAEAGDQDLYELEPLPLNPATIWAVQTVIEAPARPTPARCTCARCSNPAPPRPRATRSP